MIYIVTGAHGSGKSTCIPYLKEALPEYAIFDFDDVGVPENADQIWRAQTTEHWAKQYHDISANGQSMYLCGGVILGELLAVPSAPSMDKIRCIVLDCDDITRIKRLRNRGMQPLNQDILNWAAWIRAHHQLPNWEQHVIKDNAWEELDFSCWDSIPDWHEILTPPRLLDTSNMSIKEVGQAIIA